MKIRLLASLILLAIAACPARAADPPCPRLRLVLDPALDRQTLERDWASGKPRSEKAAVLELLSCKGRLLDRLQLDSALAKLDPLPLRGAPAPTWLVTVDLSTEAGSYNGPLTIPVQILGGRQLVPAQALGPNGRRQQINLALTGKAAWKRVPVKRAEDLLTVSCQPGEGGFVTSYRRYHPSRRGWRFSERRRSEFRESDAEFPPLHAFPR